MKEVLTSKLEGPSVGARLRDQLESAVDEIDGAEAMAATQAACSHVAVERDEASDCYRCRDCGLEMERDEESVRGFVPLRRVALATPIEIPGHEGHTVKFNEADDRFDCSCGESATRHEIDQARQDRRATRTIPTPVLPNPDILARAHARDPAAEGSWSIGLKAEAPASPQAELAKLQISNFDAAMRQSLEELRAIDAQITALNERKEAVRDDVRKALLSTDDGSYAWNGAKASIAAGAQRVKIVNAKAVPTAMMKSTPDTEKIGVQLKAGNAVDGCVLETSEPTLRVTFEKPEKK